MKVTRRRKGKVKLLKEEKETPGSSARSLAPTRTPTASRSEGTRAGGALRWDEAPPACLAETAAARGEGDPAARAEAGGRRGGRGAAPRGPRSEGGQPRGGQGARKDWSRGESRRNKVCAAEGGRGGPPQATRRSRRRAAPRAGRQVPRGSGRRGDFSGQKRGCWLSLPGPPRVPNTRLTNLLHRHLH